jgi:hypothetical protein
LACSCILSDICDDLIKLLYHEEKILDDHKLGEPQTFVDDMSLINAQIAKEK